MSITNLDPKPYVDSDGGRHGQYEYEELAENGVLLDVLPRPEFDVGENPILMAVAETVEAGSDLAGMAQVFLNGHMIAATPDQIAHARTVLELIVREGQ